jgi:hypothetical protein
MRSYSSGGSGSCACGAPAENTFDDDGVKQQQLCFSCMMKMINKHDQEHAIELAKRAAEARGKR